MIRYALGIIGTVLVSYGVWLAYPPAGFIIAGALLLTAQWEVNR